MGHRLKKQKNIRCWDQRTRIAPEYEAVYRERNMGK